MNIAKPIINFPSQSLLFGCGLSIALAASTQAAVIAQYTFDGGSPSSSISDPGWTASDLGLGAGLPGGGVSSTTETAFNLATETTNSEAGAISGDDYFTFTITANADTIIDFTQLTVDLGGNGAGSAPSYNTNFRLRTSLDNFSAPSLLTDANITTPGGNPIVLTTFTADLSGLSNISSAAPIEFRIYNFDNTDASGRFNRVDNVILEGTVSAIPEPSNYALIVATALGTIFVRRQFKNKKTI